MTIQQLRYMIQVAECASLRSAAEKAHISQPALSVAIRDLENELGKKLFARASRGMTLTLEGLEFLSYARQVIQQFDALERKFLDTPNEYRKFSISTQHYTFIVNAFIEFAKSFAATPFIFNFRETTTSGIIDDVANSYSELGVIFCSSYNETIMRNVFKEHALMFRDIIWLKPHVFLAFHHPLAQRASLRLADLEEYPCVTFDRGRGNSNFYAEEVLSNRSLRQNIRVTDRDSWANFIIGLNAYNIGTGICSSISTKDIISVPLETDEYIRVVFIRRAQEKISDMADLFMRRLEDVLSSLDLSHYFPPVRDWEPG